MWIGMIGAMMIDRLSAAAKFLRRRRTALNKAFGAMAIALAVPALLTGPASASRLKDITKIEGVRENQLIGYGLVVGLPGTGDRAQNALFTEQSLRSMLERFGVALDNERILQTRNTAAVMVTASLPGFSRNGDKIDVTVSALGDARSLQGGTLLVTPLTAADGNVYAVAQGQLIIGGFQAAGAAGSIQRGVPTQGRIPAGATVERELAFPINELDTVRYVLKNPDFTTANRIASAIDQRLSGRFARAVDLATVEVLVPADYRGQVTTMLAELESIDVETDEIARVVVDESSGTIVIGQNVRISPVAIAHGNITIRISERPIPSQPSPFSRVGETVVVPRTDIAVEEDLGNGFRVIEDNITLQELVDGLNAMGVTPRDMISILQTIKSSGAMQAELVVQ
ncbi:flagellar basal body P-ring protein FlgI [Parvularcula lutaonensis]|uniref:Flagellar P-ring protein n=1 Tax=Parvularcula lutaonensis TaxID=491923 RepID=A0ABV7MCH1_9PROT|nr:flagellar basal body P-ring protein FlgI [Parvularcula lutaonensis]GGY50753.1 flagellar P-ring protein 1 [Parvularcula lutaonensis]